MSAQNTFHTLPGISWWIIFFSFGCVCWKSRYVGQCLCGFQYHYSYLGNKLIHVLTVLVLLMSIWLMWSCFNAYLCNESIITICLPFSIPLHLLLYDLETSSMFSCLVVFDLCSLASLWWYILWATLSVHLLKLPVVVPVLSCILVYW